MTFKRQPPRLLSVDDEPAIGEVIADVARGLGIDATITSSSASFRNAFCSDKPSVVVLDLKMPEDDGVKLLRFLADQGFAGQLVISSGVDKKTLGSAARLAEAFGFGSVETLAKPFDLARLEDVLKADGDDPGLRVEAAVELEEVRTAIREGRVELHYQPKVTLANQQANGVDSLEALARLRHPRGGLIWPSLFVPIAEGEGEIDALTRRILDMALAQARRWKDAGRPLPVAVNIPASMAMSLDLPNVVEALLSQHQVEGSQLILEVTETSVMSDPEKAMEALTRVRLQGVGLSIDDFGTGYSSLIQLHLLPFSEIKVDKSLVLEIDHDADARLIVRSIIELAHNLGLSVCAEGVETQDAAAHLRSWGCDKAQGYLFARPKPAELILGLISDAGTLRCEARAPGLSEVAPAPAITAADLAGKAR
jgi:EAL domain-containing protein (putative c-di-GMP-specific phosphodiesterase class I)/CheY-like chemotaxis protein